MGLKNLISALLPSAYRAQVLGDLQERGFRIGDIVSVLPRIWWNHLRRSLAVPSLAGASEQILQRRTQRLKSWQMGWGLFWLTVAASSTFLDPAASRSEQCFWSAMVLAMLVVFVIGFYRSAQERHTALHALRQLLSQHQQRARLGSPYFLAMFSTVRLIQIYSDDGSGLYLLKFVGITFCFAYGQYRARRLQKEIDSLA